MSYTPAPDPTRGGLASKRGFRIGKWVVAVPVHFILAFSLFAGCTGGNAATTDPVVESSPTPSVTSSPSATTASPTPTPSPSKTPGTVKSVEATNEPEPTETPAKAINPPSGAFVALEALTVAASGTMSDYDRDAQFGDWIDADGDCEYTRDEILNRDLTDITSDDGCKVATGTLADPYTATTINFVRGVATSSDVQIDHVVALGNAWISGARKLSQAQRVELSNDPLNLLAVDGPTNGAKSDSPANKWLPPNVDFRCEYVATQIAVKARYNLTVTASEKNAMADVLSDCGDQDLPTGEPVGDIAGDSTPAQPVEPPVEQAPEEAPALAPVAPAPAPAPAGVYYKNCDAVRAANAAPLYANQPGYRPALDRGGEPGVACEN